MNKMTIKEILLRKISLDAIREINNSTDKSCQR